MEVALESDIRVKMRDGITLMTDVYRPVGPGQYPVLLMRVPYSKVIAQTVVYAHPNWYARRGFIVVVQDTRGRYKSEGDFEPYVNEAEDGYDTIEWAATLPMSTGKVGMYGFSYAAAAQLQAAALRPPHLTAIAPAFTGSDFYDGWSYVGGALSLAFLESWVIGDLAQATARKRGQTDAELKLAAAMRDIANRYWYLPIDELPELRTTGMAPYFFDWLEHSEYDDYWKALSLRSSHADVNVPALHIGGWYDSFLEGTIENFVGIRGRDAAGPGRDKQYLLIGPWVHMPWAQTTGQLDFGANASNFLDSVMVRWFDCWLKDQPALVSGWDRIRVFTMGINRWQRFSDWPPAVERAYLYMHSGGRANSLSGDGSLDFRVPNQEPPDTFIYDPGNPVSSLGGRSCCTCDLTPMGPADQRPVENRNDVLIYSTDPLVRDLEINGTVQLVLWAASSAVDTDFTAKLVDVYPDGRAINIADGIVRARHRESLESIRLLEPGKAYRFDIKVGSTSIVLRKNHLIRLEVSSSNFPLYSRNGNSAIDPSKVTLADCQPAVQNVFHDTPRPSHLVLPVSGDFQDLVLTMGSQPTSSLPAAPWSTC